jgi:hypothetical protein
VIVRVADDTLFDLGRRSQSVTLLGPHGPLSVTRSYVAGRRVVAFGDEDQTMRPEAGGGALATAGG